MFVQRFCQKKKKKKALFVLFFVFTFLLIVYELIIITVYLCFVLLPSPQMYIALISFHALIMVAFHFVFCFEEDWTSKCGGQGLDL